jgi:hypothetical protein
MKFSGRRRYLFVGLIILAITGAAGYWTIVANQPVLSVDGCGVGPNQLLLNLTNRSSSTITILSITVSNQTFAGVISVTPTTIPSGLSFLVTANGNFTASHYNFDVTLQNANAVQLNNVYCPENK